MRIIAALAVVLALSACSGTEEPQEPAAPEPATSVVDVMEMAVDSGYDCPSWTEVSPSPEHGYDEAATCGGRDYFIYDATQSGDQICEDRISQTPDDFRSAMLCGPNWVISADDQPSLEAIAEDMGGTLIGIP